MPVSGQSNGHPLHHPGRGKSLDDSEPFLSTNKLTSRSRGLPENNLLKSFSSDKERANSVAKIKVVVCHLKVVSLSLYHLMQCREWLLLISRNIAF